MDFHSQLREEALQTEKRKTSYGIVISPDGRILMKRCLFEIGPSTDITYKSGLWHTTVSKQVKEKSPLEAIKIALFTELGMNPEIDPLVIECLDCVDCKEKFIGELHVHTIRFTGPTKVKLSFKTEHTLMQPEVLFNEITTNPNDFMSDAIMATTAFKKYLDRGSK